MTLFEALNIFPVGAKHIPAEKRHTCSAALCAKLALGWLLVGALQLFVMAGSSTAVQQLASFVHCVVIGHRVLNGFLKHALEGIARLLLQQTFRLSQDVEDMACSENSTSSIRDKMARATAADKTRTRRPP